MKILFLKVFLFEFIKLKWNSNNLLAWNLKANSFLQHRFNFFTIFYNNYFTLSKQVVSFLVFRHPFGPKNIVENSCSKLPKASESSIHFFPTIPFLLLSPLFLFLKKNLQPQNCFWKWKVCFSFDSSFCVYTLLWYIWIDLGICSAFMYVH